MSSSIHRPSLTNVYSHLSVNVITEALAGEAGTMCARSETDKIHYKFVCGVWLPNISNYRFSPVKMLNMQQAKHCERMHKNV